MARLLKRKMSEYLQIKTKHYIKELQESKASEDKVAELKAYHQDLLKYLDDHGICFGMALCSAGMDQVKKMDWWHQGLVNIANWDGTEEKLTAELDVFLNTALNYIIPSHATKTFSPLKGVTQKNILSPDAHLLEKSGTRQSYLEISIPDDKGKHEIKTIQQRLVIGGKFNELQLNRLLDEKALAGNMCLIHSDTHALHLKYDHVENVWVIYHSNYKHSKLEEIRKKFSTKAEAAREVLSILHRKNLIIEVASFTNTPIHFPQYEQLLKESADKIAEDLDFCVEKRPQVYTNLIRIAAEPEQTKLRSVIISHLNKLILHAPEQLSAVFLLAQTYPDMLPGIVNSFRPLYEINLCNVALFSQMEQKAEGAFKLLRNIVTIPGDEVAPDSTLLAARTKIQDMFTFYDTIKLRLEDKTVLKNLDTLSTIILDEKFCSTQVEPGFLNHLRKAIQTNTLGTPVGYYKAREEAQILLDKCKYTEKHPEFVIHLCNIIIPPPTQLESLGDTDDFQKLVSKWSDFKKDQPDSKSVQALKYGSKFAASADEAKKSMTNVPENEPPSDHTHDI